MTKTELITPAFKTLVDEFNSFIFVKGYAVKKTVKQLNGETSSKDNAYGRSVKKFLIYAESIGINCIQKTDRSQIVSYRDHLKTQPSRRGGLITDSTINDYMYPIRLFFEYLFETKQIEALPLFPSNLKTQTESRQIATIDEIHKLYEMCENKRQKAILGIAFGCGLRRIELQRLNIADIQFSTAQLIVRKGKRNKRREVPIQEAILKDLKDYLINERPAYLKGKKDNYTAAFLLNNKGKRMEGEHANQQVKYLVNKTDNHELIKKDIGLHNLRHSIATILLDNGAPTEFVKDFLGHDSIDTVHIYTRRRKMKQKQINIIKNSF